MYNFVGITQSPTHFFGSSDSKSLSIIWQLQLKNEYKILNLVPFAKDHSGNDILIGVGKSNNGIIYFRDHEEGGEIDEYLEKNLDIPEKVWKKTIKTIAGSFTEFLNMIHIKK